MVLRYFDKIDGGLILDEVKFLALKHRDKVLIRLDAAEPEVSKFVRKFKVYDT